MPSAPASPGAELLPCPFCGSQHVSLIGPTCKQGDPYDASDRAYPVAVCGECGAETMGKNWDRSCRSAAEAWNRRVETPQ